MQDKFLSQPIEACTTIFSIGPRGSGKTYIMMESVKVWLQQNVFNVLYLIIPDWEDEQHDSYAWLKEYKNVVVYQSYTSNLGKEILERSAKNTDENRKKGVPLEKYMLAVDDATGEGKNMMKCSHLVKIAISARHKRVHTWFCLHACAGVIPPKVRYMTGYIFIYDVHKEHKKTLFKEFINFPDFKNFNEFNAFFEKYVSSQEHGCLLINHQYAPKSYSPWVAKWNFGN